MRALLTALVFLGAAAATAGQALGPDRPWENYEVLIKRNAFSKTRGQATRVTAPTAHKTAAPRPERYTVLTGISQRGGRFVAFLEEVQGDTTKVAAGDEVAGGKVVSISLDGLEFEKEGKTTKVAIGSSLSLGPGSAPAPTGAAPNLGATGTPAGGTSSEAKDLATSILERLRQRREEELRKK